MSLTDEERDSLRDAAFDAFGDYPDGLNELVESIVTARVAAALREAADEVAKDEAEWNRRPSDQYEEGRRDAYDLTESMLRDRADSYDRTATTEGSQ